MVLTKTDLKAYNNGQLKRLYFYCEGNSVVQKFFTDFTDYLAENDLKNDVYLNNTKSVHLFNLYVLPAHIDRESHACYVNSDSYLAHMSTTGPWVKTEKCNLYRQFVRLFKEVREAVAEG